MKLLTIKKNYQMNIVHSKRAVFQNEHLKRKFMYRNNGELPLSALGTGE